VSRCRMSSGTAVFGRAVEIWESFAVAAFLTLAATASANAEPVGERTSELLNAIIDGYRDSQAQLQDFQMEGNVRTAPPDGKGEEVAFLYFQLGDKVRVDASYSPDSARKGRTYRWVRANGRSLCYIPQTGSARVLPAAKLHMQNDLAYLDALAISRSWYTHVGHIEHLLHRGWEPDKENMLVRSEQADTGELLLHVQYTSTRGGGNTRCDWFFAPNRGYKVVEAEASGTYPDGKPLWQARARYEVRQVAPGLWRPVGVEMDSESWDPEGKSTVVHRVIETSQIAANTGNVQETMFTLGGLGVQPGAIVTDFTRTPPGDFEYLAGSAVDVEDSLDEIMDLSEEPPGRNGTAAPRARETSPTERTSGPPAAERAGGNEGWGSVVVGCGLLFVVGLAVAYLLRTFWKTPLAPASEGDDGG